MKNLEKNIEKYNINCQIEFSSQGLNKCLFDCDFNIEIIPFRILMYCKEYNIAKTQEGQNGNYSICFSKAHTGKEINLFFQNYNIKNELKFIYQIESLEGNYASKPEIVKEKEHLKLTLGNKDKKSVERLICQLTIIFNNFFSIKLNIDCFLFPFTYLFQVYDYNKRIFRNEISIYIKGYKE